jgi:hypothetical protein
VTIYGYWIDNWIYWIAQLHNSFTVYYTLQLTTTESLLLLWRPRLQLCNHRRNQLLWRPFAITHYLVTTAGTLPYCLSVKVKVTLRPTTCRSVSPGFKAHEGLTTGYLFLLTFTRIGLAANVRLYNPGGDHKENTVSDSSTVAWRHYRNRPQRKHQFLPIVALLSNGCKQAFPLLTVTYSVHVTISNNFAFHIRDN